MKSTFIDQNGDVRCPNCGARNNFVSKRTAKAKWATGVAAVATLGIAAAAAPVVIPKRLKCNGCGANLKRGGAVMPVTPAPQTEAAPYTITAIRPISPVNAPGVQSPSGS